MGCCSSTQRNPEDGNDDPSRVVPAAGQETQERSGQTLAGRTSATRSARAANAPNRPLVLPPASSEIALPLAYTQTARSLTREGLTREREAFFDTRVSGRREIWAALKTVCTLLEARDAVQAQAILDAVDCTCPTGEVWEPEVSRSRDRRRARGGVFDQLGERYVVPTWVVGVPADISVEPEITNATEGTLQGDDEATSIKEKGSSIGSIDRQSGEESEQVGEKGKGKAIDSEPLIATKTAEKENLIKVRARLSHNAQDVIVKIRNEDNLSEVMSKIKDKAQINPASNLRIIYLGRVLKADQTLEVQGWTVGHILNVYVFDPA